LPADESTTMRSTLAEPELALEQRETLAAIARVFRARQRLARAFTESTVGGIGSPSGI